MMLLWSFMRSRKRMSVDKVKARAACFDQNLQFGGKVTVELAAIRGAPTGSDRGHLGTLSEEVLQFGQRQQGLVQVIQTELEKGRFFCSRCGALDHLGNGGPDDGDADLADAGADKLW